MNAQQLQSVTVEAKVIRKDGTVEDLGTVAAWAHEDPQPDPSPKDPIRKDVK